jgi:thioredoxin reductase (NADPH)
VKGDGIMVMRDVYDVIIVGGGPAGLAAGLYSQRAVMKTMLFEKGLIGGQIAISKEVENYPGVEGMTGLDLAEKLLQHARGFGLPIIREEVVAVTAGQDFHEVKLANGDIYRATALILASGGTAKKLGVPGEADYLGRGVSYCATCDGFFFRDRTVVVVGGGDTAAEEALYLARLARKVYLVHRGSSLKATRLLQKRVAAEPLVEIIWNTVVSCIKGTVGVVEGVELEDTRTGERRNLQTDGVFIFIGFSPNSVLVPPEVKVNEDGFVVTDDKCETSVRGVFAVGDMRKKYANQIVIAAGDGALAALAAAEYVELRKAEELART